ncbi:MAG: ACT domain-containing protein [Pseudomonadota bacterium]
MAEADLSKLLANLSVTRHDGCWRFETIAPEAASWSDLVTLRAARDILMLFQESEGLTVILAAAADTPQSNRWVWLELNVFSDLQAVGFLARIAAALSDAGIPCNAVAAFHHDHIFVPETRASDAVAAIEALRNPA